MHAVRFDGLVLEVAHEFLIQRHHRLQIDLPELLSNRELKADVFVAHEVELVYSCVELLVGKFVLAYLVLKLRPIPAETLGVSDTE
jgi:hypothetical protein